MSGHDSPESAVTMVRNTHEGDNFAGHNAGDLQNLSDQVHRAWEDYGQLPSHMPPELAQRHARIHGAAIEQARAQGWSAELGDDD